MTSTTASGRRKVQLSFVIPTGLRGASRSSCSDSISGESPRDGHRAGINALAWDADTKRLYSAGRDATIRVWSVPREVLASSSSKQPDSLFNSACQNCMTLAHHTDWVNDIVLASSGNYLLSASSDTSIKVWNVYKGFCMSTLRTHHDYVKCLSYARHRDMVASAGFDNVIFLWDVAALTALTSSRNTVTTSSLPGKRGSIYSLSMLPDSSLVAAGSTDTSVRLWDTRVSRCVAKFKGHGDTVRSVKLAEDGRTLISGCSDGTVRLWSVGEQRTVSNLKLHRGGVWALATPDPINLNRFYSSGRDGCVLFTDISGVASASVVHQRHPSSNDHHITPPESLIASSSGGSHPEVSHLLGRHQESILALSLMQSDSEVGVWTAASMSSDITLWRHSSDTHDTKPVEGAGDMASSGDMSSITTPVTRIPGQPHLRKFAVLPDKRNILTQDSCGSVGLYSVFLAKQLLDLGPKVDFNAELKARSEPPIFVPNWFSVDIKTGSLTIYLNESDAVLAWVPARSLVAELPLLVEREPESRVNLGCFLLMALFRNWPRTFGTLDSGSASSPPQPVGNRYFSVRDTIPLVLMDKPSGRMLIRTLVKDCGATEADRALLAECCPSWIYELIVERHLPPFPKISFALMPAPNSGVSQLMGGTMDRGSTRGLIDRLNTNETATVAKVIDHINERILSLPKDSPHRISMFCGEHLLPNDMDLRTVRSLYARGELTLTFKVTNP